MPIFQVLTDRTLAPSTAITPTTLIHIVTTGDTSQNAAGSSYKAELQQLSSIFSGGTDTFVTGGTYSYGDAIFTNSTGGTFTVSGFTEPFSGGSGNCITDLFTTNIHSCSPLNINPLDEGNVYFGSTSGVTIDVTNSRVGIGTSAPTTKLHVSGNTKIDGSLSATTISATTYLNLPTTSSGSFLPLSGGTVTGQTFFTSGLTITGDTIIIDSTGISTAIDTSTRELVDSSSSVSVDWENRSLYDDLGTDALEWTSTKRKLLDVTSADAVNWNDRLLTKSDGATVSFDWENGILTGQTDIKSTTISATTISGTSLNISGSSSSDLVRITQTGVGNAFVVEDSTNPDSTPFVIDTSGNTGIGLTSPTQKLHVSGNTKIDGGLTADTISATTYYNLPTKEVFYKSHSNEPLFNLGDFFEPEFNGGTGPAYISGSIPYDFGENISSEIILIPVISETQTVFLNFSSGPVGGSFSATTGTTSFPKTYVQNIIDTINVDNFFSGITANQVFSLNVFDNGYYKLVIGIKFRYKPV